LRSAIVDNPAPRDDLGSSGGAASLAPARPLPDIHAMARMDWKRIALELDERGYALVPALLGAEQCADLVALYDERARFRSRVVMERHRYGVGEYKYFSYPLPGVIARMRTALYRGLAPLANRWERRLGGTRRYPATLKEFLAQCHAAGQSRPTPLLLRYQAGGYNCLHQDLYGEIAFPFQLTCMLSRPGRDFDGGQFLLMEQRPRAQSRGEAVALEQGSAIVFPNRFRPVAGARGERRVTLRHGVSTVTRGERWTLGIILHDAA
jgi:uncharacterized protein